MINNCLELALPTIIGIEKPTVVDKLVTELDISDHLRLLDGSERRCFDHLRFGHPGGLHGHLRFVDCFLDALSGGTVVTACYNSRHPED